MEDHGRTVQRFGPDFHAQYEARAREAELHHEKVFGGNPQRTDESDALLAKEAEMNRKGFIIKDSGERKQFASGMVRDITTGKIGWHKVADGPMLKRWAIHLTGGAVKYPDVAPGVANWTLAEGDAEAARFKESAFRHFMQWYFNDRDEDHGAAVFFNINGYEYVKAKMEAKDGK